MSFRSWPTRLWQALRTQKPITETHCARCLRPFRGTPVRVLRASDLKWLVVCESCWTNDPQQWDRW